MHELIIVGAGPAGFAAAAAGRARGLEPLVLERELRVGGAWAKMAPDMRCLSPRIRDRMPDGATAEGVGARAQAGEVLAMIEAYAQRAAFAVHLGVCANALRDDRDSIALTTSEGELHARRVVVATGEYATPFHLPLSGEFGGQMEHSSAFRPWDVGTDERVCVVGAGNSGAEIAVALCRRGIRVTLATRRPIRRPSADPLGFESTLSWWMSGIPRRSSGSERVPVVDGDLYEAVRAGRINVVSGAGTLLSDGLLTRDGKEITCDRIVLATGFRRDTAWLSTAISLDARGLPGHDRGVSTRVRGLGFLGLPGQRTRRSGFLAGLVGDATQVVRRL